MPVTEKERSKSGKNSGVREVRLAGGGSVVGTRGAGGDFGVAYGERRMGSRTWAARDERVRARSTVRPTRVAGPILRAIEGQATA